MAARHALGSTAAHLATAGNAGLDRDDEALFAALMCLPERERQLLLMRHFGGQSVAEIAQVLGRPVGT